MLKTDDIVARFSTLPDDQREGLIKRLGRSPDKADAVAMAWYRGVSGGYQPRQGSRRPLPKVTPVAPSLGSDLDQVILDEHPGLSSETLRKIARVT